jgi:hypothetical protein
MPKFKLTDERRPLCLNGSLFIFSFHRGALVGARSNNAVEHRRGRDAQKRWIELNCADQGRDEDHTAYGDHGPSGQDEFAATLDLGSEFICLSFFVSQVPQEL